MRAIFAGALLLSITRTAFAADFPTHNYYTAPTPLSASSWAGPYLGVNAGYEWGDVSNTPARPSGFAGGIEAGYNWQQGQFVFGGETDMELSAAEDTFAPWRFSSPWFGTLRGRGGIALGNILIFGTAGLAYGDVHAQNSVSTETHASIGWAAGGGLEVGFTPHWSAKAEWLYLDLADRSYSLTGTNSGLAANLLRFGVNYHF
jgi:outer membrane immunogenic protein